MRKFVIGIILLCLTISICCGCKKNSLPMPLYPLDEAIVEAGLEETTLLWKITKKEIWGEGRVYYDLCDKDGKAIAVISSVGDGSTRLLQLTFYTSSAITAPLPGKDWEKAVNLATLLYGGFREKGQVFEAFQNTYEDMAMADNTPGSTLNNKESIRWRMEINGVDCFVGLHYRDRNQDTPATEMVSIIFSNVFNHSNESESMANVSKTDTPKGVSGRSSTEAA